MNVVVLMGLMAIAVAFGVWGISFLDANLLSDDCSSLERCAITVDVIGISVLEWLLFIAICGQPLSDKCGRVACGVHLLKSYLLSSATVRHDAQNHEKSVQLRLTLRVDELRSCLKRGKSYSDCTCRVMEAAFPFSPRTITDLYVSVAGARRIRRLCRRNRCEYVQLEFRIKEPYFGRHTTLDREYILFSAWDAIQILHSGEPDELGMVKLWTGDDRSVELVFAELDIFYEDLEPDTFIEIS